MTKRGGGRWRSGNNFAAKNTLILIIMEHTLTPDNAAILKAAHDAWAAAAPLRAARQRNKLFTYGQQWSDHTLDADGNIVTDYERYSRDGATPITNNLMRQLVKTIIGRFRTQHLHNEEQREAPLQEAHQHNQLDELDSRALEEFLIAGACVQRVESAAPLLGDPHVRIENVNLNRFFVNAFTDPLGRDCEIAGQLHDMSIAHLVKRVAGGSRQKAAWVRSLYGPQMEERIAATCHALGADRETSVDFWQGMPGKCRAIEVWTLESREVLVCHNRRTAQVTLEPLSAARRLKRDKDVDTRWDVITLWHCRWFSPMGDLLCEYDSTLAHGGHPFAIKFYPLTDGEVHAFVEDIIDQQKYVNRLITLIDHVMMSSAKGVLLFPENALPDGFTWHDMRRVWSRCNGILPYVPTLQGDKPQQVIANNTNVGAYDMVQLQMKLLEEISGVSGALQGKNTVAGNSASLYQNETQNAIIALADVFDTFNHFRRQRDRLVLAAAPQQ